MAWQMEHIEFQTAGVHKVKLNTPRMTWEMEYIPFSTTRVTLILKHHSCYVREKHPFSKYKCTQKSVVCR